MTEIRFKTQFNKNYVPAKGEVNNEPSQTVPDQSMTIRHLLLNHSRGITSDQKDYSGGYYDTEIPNISDITDLVEHAENLKIQEKQLEAKIKASMERIKKKEVVTPTEPEKVQENEPEQGSE